MFSRSSGWLREPFKILASLQHLKEHALYAVVLFLLKKLQEMGRQEPLL